MISFDSPKLRVNPNAFPTQTATNSFEMQRIWQTSLPFTALSPPREIELHRPSDLMEKNSKKKKKTLLKALIFIPQAFLPALKAQCIFSPNYFISALFLTLSKSFFSTQVNHFNLEPQPAKRNHAGIWICHTTSQSFWLIFCFTTLSFLFSFPRRHLPQNPGAAHHKLLH